MTQYIANFARTRFLLFVCLLRRDIKPRNTRIYDLMVTTQWLLKQIL